MTRIFKIAVFFLITSCISENSLKPIIPGYIFHSNSSKIWIIQQEIKFGKDVTPKIKQNKKTITYFKDGEFYIQKLMNLGTNKGEKGNFSVNITEQDTTLLLRFANENQLLFKINYLNDKKMSITSKENALKWKLTNYPKPF